MIVVKSILDLAFCVCAERMLAIPDTVVRICPGFQESDEKVAQIEIPDSIQMLDGFFRFSALQEVKFQNGSHVRKIGGFSHCISLRRIELPPSIEVIKGDSPDAAFCSCLVLREVILAPGGRLREIQGFSDCPALLRIDIPASVELINGFNQCTSLVEVNFPVNSYVREIHGFTKCPSLREIHFPASVEQITGFDDCHVLGSVVIADHTRIRRITGFWKTVRIPVRRTAFISYLGGNYLKHSRRRLHLRASAGVRERPPTESDDMETDSLPSDFDVGFPE
jgi:hypothetical protein